MSKSRQLTCTSTRKGYVYTNVGRVAQSVERRRSNPKVVGSIATLVRVFLCPCVGPVPSVGLTLTWFIWDRNLALYVTLHSLQLILLKKYKCYTANVCINVIFKTWSDTRENTLQNALKRTLRYFKTRFKTLLIPVLRR